MDLMVLIEKTFTSGGRCNDYDRPETLLKNPNIEACKPKLDRMTTCVLP